MLLVYRLAEALRGLAISIRYFHSTLAAFRDLATVTLFPQISHVITNHVRTNFTPRLDTAQR